MGLSCLGVDPRYVAGGGNEDKGNILAGVPLITRVSTITRAAMTKIRYRRWPNLNKIGSYTRPSQKESHYIPTIGTPGRKTIILLDILYVEYRKCRGRP